MEELELNVDGIDCASCVKKIEKALEKKFKGDKEVHPSMDLSTGVLLVEYNPETTTPEEIIKTIDDSGYKACEIE